MESNQNKKAVVAGRKKSLTPRQLIKRRMEYPDIPITDEDLKNMKLNDKDADSTTTTPEKNIPLTGEEKANADELADELKKDNTGMSYQPDL